MASQVAAVRPGVDAELERVLLYLGVPKESIRQTEGISAPSVDSAVVGASSVAVFFASSLAPELLGTDDNQKAEVDQWVSFALYTLKVGIDGKVLRIVRDSVRSINQVLENREYFAGKSITLADLFIHALLDAYMKTLNPKQLSEVAHLVSWFTRVNDNVTARQMSQLSTASA